MDRIKRATPATISDDWKNGTTILDPGVVTIGITAADGTVVVPAGTATAGSGAAARTFDLTTTHTAALDTLTATWTSPTQGADTTTHEIVGDFLFNIDDLAALPGLETATDAKLRAARVQAEQLLERLLHDAFVPRYRRETIVGDGGTSFMLSMPRVRAVRSISIDGTALTAGELAALTVGLYLITGRRWRGNITVGYEYGWDAPEEPIRDAALAIAHHDLTAGPGQAGVGPRVTYVTTPEGRIDYSNGVLGLPAVERAIALYDMNTGVA